MKVELKNEIKEILGTSALTSNELQVPDHVSKLVKSFMYLCTQFEISSQFVDGEDRADECETHIKYVLENVKSILKGEL